MKKFLKENKGLSTLAFIALITIIVYILSVYYPHKFPNTDIWLELLFQLSIGYIINFIFYILQVYLPRRKMEMIAYSLILPYEVQSIIISLINVYESSPSSITRHFIGCT